MVKNMDLLVTVNGKQFNVSVEVLKADNAEVSAAPAAATAAPKAEAPKAAPKAIGAGEKITSPFPGLIKNLLVAEGASVKKDQPVMVLEAMKMDNEITATCDGKVSFAAAKGANVQTGDVLAVIG